MAQMRRFSGLMIFVMGLAFGAVSPPAAAMSGPPPEAAFYRAEALARIAIVQAEQGDAAGATATIALAQESAQATMDEWDRHRIAVLIAKAQALAGDAAGALKTARSIPEETQARHVALCLVAKILAVSGHAMAADRAIALAYNKLAVKPTFFGVAMVSWVEARRGNFTAVRMWAKTNLVLETRAVGMLAVATALAEAGDEINARNVLQSLFDFLDTDDAVSQRVNIDGIAALTVWAQARVGDVTGARDTALRVSNRDDRIRTLVFLAAAQAARGDARGARETIDLAAIGERSWIGLKVEAVTEELAEGLRLDDVRGVHVNWVIDGGPADRAGIMEGDVILLFNSEPVSDAADFRRLYEALAPGSVVRLEVLRYGVRVPVVITLGRDPSPVGLLHDLMHAALAAEAAVAVARANAGDSLGALDVIRRIVDPADRILAFAVFGAARAAMGDPADTRRAAVLARETLDTLPDDMSRRWRMATVALAQMEAGDSAEALESLGQAPDAEPFFEAPVLWGRFLTGDLEGLAFEWLMMFNLHFEFFRDDRPLKPVVIAEWKAKAGDLAGALAAAMDITDSSDPAEP